MYPSRSPIFKSFILSFFALALLIPKISLAAKVDLYPHLSTLNFKTSNTAQRHYLSASGTHLAQLEGLEESIGEAAFFRLEEMIITSASKYAQRIIESPHAISVITREDIERTYARDIWDLFKFHPGTMHVYSFGFRSEVIIRGLPESFSPRILVLNDGVPLYDPTFGGMPWFFTPYFLPSIDRIEVIRGASSTLYGANAFSGVINIIPKKIPEGQSLYAYASGGNLEFTQEEFSWTRGVSDNVRFRLGGLFRHDNGFGGDNGDTQFDAQTLGQGMFDLEYDPSDSTHFKFYSYGKYNRAKEEFFGTYGQLNETISSALAGTRIQHDFDDNNSLSFQTSFLDREYNPNVQPPISNECFRRESNSDLQYIHRFGEKDTLVTGANYRLGGYNCLNFFGLPNNSQYVTITSFFINNDFRIMDDLILTMGGRYEYDSITESQLSGRANITYLPTDNHALRASFARAVRTPSLSEDRFNLSLATGAPFPPGTITTIIGNPNLKAETVLAGEFGYMGSFLDGRLNTDLQFYYNKVNDIITGQLISIDLTGTPPEVLVGFNPSGNARIYGVEASFDFQPFKWWKGAINYTFTKQTGFETGRFPKNIVNVKNRFAFDNGFSLQILFNWTGPYRFWDRSTSTSNSIGNLFKLDVTIAQKFYKDHFEVAAVGQNLVQSPHQEFSPLLQVDRAFYGVLSYRY